MANRRGLKSPTTGAVHRPAPGSVAAKEIAEAAAVPERQARNVVRPAIVKHLVANIALPVHVDEMVTLTNANKSSVQNAMLVLIGEGKLRIETIVAGNTWVYRGPVLAAVEAAPALPAREVGSKQLYTELGTASDGSKILEDEEGKLWRATVL